MATDDIYRNKKQYDKFRKNYKEFTKPEGQRKYFVKNPENLKYFPFLFNKFNSQDLSFVRRNRLLQDFMIICTATEKDLKDCGKSDIDNIMSFMYENYKSIESIKPFVRNGKRIWRILFPELDNRGRPDETINPYVWNHVKIVKEGSKEKRDRNKADLVEALKVIEYFNQEPHVQAYLAVLFETMCRPQELSYCTVQDSTFFEGYTHIEVSEHTKEGVKKLQCVYSHPFLIKLKKHHEQWGNPESFLFLNADGKQLNSLAVNKRIKEALRRLKIGNNNGEFKPKTLTVYDYKRWGISARLLRDESPHHIMKLSGIKNLSTLQKYDITTQKDAFKKELAKAGFIPENEELVPFLPESKNCLCGEMGIPFTEKICPRCNRSIDVKDLEAQSEITKKAQTKIEKLSAELEELKKYKEILQQLHKVMPELAD